MMYRFMIIASIVLGPASLGSADHAWAASAKNKTKWAKTKTKWAKNKTKWPECFCTDRQGKRREMGDIICLTVGGRSFMAKCVMAQNNPFWRDQNYGCLSSSLPNKQSVVANLDHFISAGN